MQFRVDGSTQVSCLVNVAPGRRAGRLFYYIVTDVFASLNPTILNPFLEEYLSGNRPITVTSENPRS